MFEKLLLIKVRLWHMIHTSSMNIFYWVDELKFCHKSCSNKSWLTNDLILEESAIVLQWNHIKESKTLRTTSNRNVFHNTYDWKCFEHFANLELLNKTENIKNNNIFASIRTHLKLVQAITEIIKTNNWISNVRSNNYNHFHVNMNISIMYKNP